jgi:hypothetical protein
MSEVTVRMNLEPLKTRNMRKLFCNVSMIVCIFSGMKFEKAHSQSCTPCANLVTNESDCDPTNADGDCSVAIGGNSTASGDYSVALGTNSTASGVASVAIGNCGAIGVGSISIGVLTESTELNAISVGTRVKALEQNSLALGRLVQSDAEAAYIFGNGIGSPLFTNSISNSMMFGMNSTLPTMFIEGSSGAGTWGRVGIGTTAPEGILHVRDENGDDTDLIIDRHGSAQANLRFNTGSTGQRARIGLNNSGNHLYYDMVQANSDHIFQVNGSTEAMRILGASGNVAIGNSVAAARLHVMTTESELAQFFFNDNAAGATRPRLNILGFAGRITLQTAFNTGGADLVLATTAAPSAVHIRQNGNVGIGTTAPSGRLHVNGTVFVATTPNGNPMSDAQLGINLTTRQVVDLGVSHISFKEEVEDIEFDREAFLNLRPVDFRWKEACGGGADVGLIAQEVAETFPSLALYGFKRTYLDNGEMLLDSSDVPLEDTTQMEVRGVRYHKLPVYLLALAKSQQNEVNELRQQVTELMEIVNGCCATQPMHRIGSEDEALNSRESVADEYVLLRNDPNPFSDYTDIVYKTRDCNQCQIIITDMSGRVVKRIQVRKNEGTVRLYSSEIGNGLFTYSIVQDGRVVITKRMVSSR